MTCPMKGSCSALEIDMTHDIPPGARWVTYCNLSQGRPSGQLSFNNNIHPCSSSDSALDSSDVTL